MNFFIPSSGLSVFKAVFSSVYKIVILDIWSLVISSICYPRREADGYSPLPKRVPEVLECKGAPHFPHLANVTLEDAFSVIPRTLDVFQVLGIHKFVCDDVIISNCF